MSIEILSLYRDQRKEQIEEGPFSETFSILDNETNEVVSTFLGVFDESHKEENKDGGNFLQKKLHPRVLVDSVPSGLDARKTKIQREEGEVYTFSFAGLDSEGISILWLV